MGENVGHADFRAVEVVYNNTVQTLQDYEISATSSFKKSTGLDGDVQDMVLRVHFIRYWLPFVMKYHLPCASIVILVQVSYFIPPTAVPGRIALIVTNFLVLNNIFSGHQVSDLIYKHYSLDHLVVPEIPFYLKYYITL